MLLRVQNFSKEVKPNNPNSWQPALISTILHIQVCISVTEEEPGWGPLHKIQAFAREFSFTSVSNAVYLPCTREKTDPSP